MREGIARNLPRTVPISFVERYKHLVAAGIAAAFLLGTGVGTAVGYRARSQSVAKTSGPVTVPAEAQPTKTPVVVHDEGVGLQALVAELKKRFEEARGDSLSLRDKVVLSDQRAAELESRLSEVEKQSTAQGQEVIHARDELSAARSELSQAKDSVSASQKKIDSLQYELADREARLTEVSASAERGREMLSAGREIRDIMGARDLHIVDVIDRDGKGRAKKAFGRAFYTQGKSLIFYAFDLDRKSVV